MSRYSHLYFDIETDGLKPDLTTIHFVAIGDEKKEKIASPETAVKILQEADLLIGHNIINFDIPILQKFFPEFKPKKVFDTYIASELIYSDLYTIDIRHKKWKKLPPRLLGSHKLEAWGFRLGVLKDDFGKRTDWQYTEANKQEFENYGLQDIRVTRALYHYLKSKIVLEAFELEQQVKTIITRQEEYGFMFNKEEAERLLEHLYTRLLELDDELQKTFPPKKVVVGKYKKSNKKKGIIAGDPKISIVRFNPTSRIQIAERLYEKYGWVSPKRTRKGNPKIDDEVLEALPYPEVKLLTEYLMINKRIGQLAEGKQALLKYIDKDGRIHGKINTLGAISRRMTHYNPNLAQIPNTASPYGKEFRSLFIVPEGKKLVGIDASGLELRCLAHYLARWDNGQYINKILKGDIHTENQRAVGLKTRNDAKRFIYGFLYGAYPTTLAKIKVSDPNLSWQKLEKIGNNLIRQFMGSTPGLIELLKAVKQKMYQGYIKSLYGVNLLIREKFLHDRTGDRKVLNLLLQSAGAIVMKQALVLFDQYLQEAGYIPGEDYEFVANVHDEWQVEVNEDIAEEVAELGIKAIQDAGKVLNFRCPLDGEAKIGNNWAETH